MAKEKLYAPNIKNWYGGQKKPFDYAVCGACITQHAVLHCGHPNHEELRDAARKALPGVGGHVTTSYLKAHYRQIVAIRRKYAACWGEKSRG